MASNRPRRSTRIRPDNSLASISTSSTVSTTTTTITTTSTTKRQRPAKLDPDSLEYLLTNPKSKLTTVDPTDVFNIDTWFSLSEESRNRLIKLLPPTAFTTFKLKIDPTHPSVVSRSTPDAVQIDDTPPQPSQETFDQSFFSDPHFLAALRTFQDHLYSGWMTASHTQDVETYLRGVRDGTMHAPWKDQVWEREHVEEVEEQNNILASPRLGSRSRAGDAKDMKLTDLVRSGSVQVGDILVYKRVFTLSSLTVEKDVIVTSCNPSWNSLEVTAPPGTSQYLPQSLVLSPNPVDDVPEDERLQIMTITTPSSLETGILDIDGRIDKAHRPNGNAWKTISVWKHKDGGDVAASIERGPRDNTGTLFYLRNCLYYDR